LNIAGLCENGLKALQKTKACKPDVVLMDIRMPVMDGIEAMKQIKRELPGTIVLMLTIFAEDRFIVDAMAGGADGFLLKDMPSKLIVQTIHEAMNGDVILPAQIASRIAAKLSVFSNKRVDTLDEAKLKKGRLFFHGARAKNYRAAG